MENGLRMKYIRHMKKSCLLLAFFITGLASAGINDGLLFYASFDKTVEPEVALGARTVKAGDVRTVPGKTGGAALLDGSSGLVYTVPGNIEMDRGTAALWARADTDMASDGYNFSLIRAQHLALNKIGRKLFFMTGNNVEGVGFKWDYGLMNQEFLKFKPGEWHHYCIVWDKLNGYRSLYVDGRLFRRHDSAHFPAGISGSAALEVGTGFRGAVDEFHVFSRPLDAAEIEKMYIDPAGTARQVDRSAAETEIEPIGFNIPVLPPQQTVVNPGEPFQAKIELLNRSGRPQTRKFTFTLRDAYLNDCGSIRKEITLEPRGTCQFTWPVIPPKRGSFKVEAAWDGKLRDVTAFAAWDKRQEPDPESFFGNHVNAWSNGAFLEQADRLGQNWQRNHNMLQTTWWTRVEPHEGERTHDNDFQLRAVRKFNMPVLGQLFTTPYWGASERKERGKGGYYTCWNPDLAKFDRYVRHTVNRYRNEIRHWEIWNEPGVSMFFGGTPEQFGMLVRTAVRAVRETDPDAIVMAAGFTAPAAAWQLRAAKAGAFRGLDAISFHCYQNTVTPIEHFYDSLRQTVDRFQELAVAYGDGKKLPVWDSEGGIGATTFFRGLDMPFLPPESKRDKDNSLEAAKQCVKGEAVRLALGIVRHFYYLQNPPNRSGYGMYSNTSALDINNAPRPHLMSRVAMQEQLDYTDFAALVRQEESRFWAVVFKHRFRPECRVMLWTGENGNLKVTPRNLPECRSTADLFGNPLPLPGKSIIVTDLPQYLTVAESDPGKVADAFRQARIDVTVPPQQLKKETNEDGEAPPLPPQTDFSAPLENPAAVFQVDLRRFCNMDFADDAANDGKGGWTDEGDLNDLRDFKPGRRNFFGVPFDVIEPGKNNGKAVITLAGKQDSPLPRAVRSIPVNRPASILYFLHAASWAQAAKDIARYELRYSDGASETAGVTTGGNCANWWGGTVDPLHTRIVPVRVTNTMTGKPAWRYLYLYEYRLTKHRGRELRSIDFISETAGSTPVLVGITGM